MRESLLIIVVRTWDWIKYNVRAYSTNYSKKKAKVRNEQEKELQKDLDNAKVSFETNPTDADSNLLNTAHFVVINKGAGQFYLSSDTK